MVEADKIVMDGPENVNVMTFLEAHSSFFLAYRCQERDREHGTKNAVIADREGASRDGHADPGRSPWPPAR